MNSFIGAFLFYLEEICSKLVKPNLLSSKLDFWGRQAVNAPTNICVVTVDKDIICAVEVSCYYF